MDWKENCKRILDECELVFMNSYKGARSLIDFTQD